MSLWKKLRHSPATRTAMASYLAFASTALWGLTMIPVAVAFLEKEELGLWTLVNAFLGYLVWMDLGVGPATGRMMADAVARRDQLEINRWWTATRAVLLAQGLLIILLGLALVPLLLGFLGIPANLKADARWLLIGGLLVTGLSLPMRGAPGLFTAQNRFYWVPLVQIFAPWINLAVFFFLLREGLGLKSYIWAMAASQAATWLTYSALILAGPDRPRLDLGGLEKRRYGKLFKFSAGLSVSGLADSILRSLPAIVIARMGGLATVPVYNFSWKGPQLASGLVQRTYQAVYPGLQRLHVTGKREAFQEKHRAIGMLTLGIGLCAAGFVLAFNTLIVQLLAGESFYAGPAANTGFALAMVTLPMSGLFRILLPISGNLGKMPLLALGQLVFFALIAPIVWTLFGLAGIAFAFSLTLLIKGVYGYVRGTAGCGYERHGISKSVAALTLVALALIALCGFIGSEMPWGGGLEIGIFDRRLGLPPLWTVCVSLIPSAVGCALALPAIRSLLRR